jgi:hypothetical protein
MQVRPAYYRNQATECRRLARQQTGESRELLLNVAELFDRLAERAAKDLGDLAG